MAGMIDTSDTVNNVPSVSKWSSLKVVRKTFKNVGKLIKCLTSVARQKTKIFSTPNVRLKVVLSFIYIQGELL